MQDRVAEVLSQRAALDNGTAAGIILSLLLHGGLTAVAVYAAMHATAPKMANVLNIRFAPMPRASTSMTPATAKPAAKKPVAPKIEAPKAEPLKPSVTKAPPEKDTVPLSPFGKSAKKGSENPVPPPPKPATGSQVAPGSGVSASDVPIGGAGVTGLEGGDFPYTIYIERMKTLIGTHWFRPQVGAGATTTIYFVIDRDGTIRDTRVETVSGNGAFDRAAERAVRETSPLPPLPFGYNGTYLGVHLTFR